MSHHAARSQVKCHATDARRVQSDAIDRYGHRTDGCWARGEGEVSSERQIPTPAVAAGICRLGLTDFL